jgi:hypothetical protein
VAAAMTPRTAITHIRMGGVYQQYEPQEVRTTKITRATKPFSEREQAFVFFVFFVVQEICASLRQARLRSCRKTL